MEKGARIKQELVKQPMPVGVKPMLCTLLNKPFDDPDYLFEIKWDGYRLIAYKDSNTIRLSSGGGHDYTKKYPPIARGIENWSHDLVLDGGAIVLNCVRRPVVSAPVSWAEIRSWLDPAAFTMRTMAKRLEKKGDLLVCWIKKLGRRMMPT